MQQLLQETLQAFESRFGRKPQWCVTAPGRVNVIGEHTDYNDGFVFPMAIERNVIIVAAPAADADAVPEGKAKIFSTAQEAPAELTLSGDVQPGDSVRWFDYVQGVVTACLNENANLTPPSFVAMIHSNVPLGGSLSSSAALEVATATLLEAMTGVALDPVKKAFLCQWAEHHFAKMPCGIMDQFISALGVKDNIMLLDCRSCETTMVPFVKPELGILVTNSKVKHTLSGSEYPERRADCMAVTEILGVPSLRELSLDALEAGKEKLTERQYRRAWHVVTEIKRTTDAAEALKNGEYAHFGQLMYASHDSMRDDFEISCQELDILVEIARKIGIAGGVYGSRMTGGGFGGCTVSLVETAKIDAIVKTLKEEYARQTGIEPDPFLTRPAQGARIL